MTAVDRAQILSLVAEGKANGLSQTASCEEVSVEPRTVQRWRLLPVLEDGRKGPRTKPANRLSELERAKIIAVATSAEFINRSPHQIVPTLADRGEFVASESSFYRVMKAGEVLAHRGRSQPRVVARPKALQATKPNEIYSWDITYLLSSVRGQYFYLYMFLDIFSRKIVGWRVHEVQSADLSSNLLTEICEQQGITKSQLTMHADNGGPMKGATMLATLQALGVMPSFSRPAVSNDNPFSESLFRTLKYRPAYASQSFANLTVARQWVADFVNWYNHEHRHSAIGLRLA